MRELIELANGAKQASYALAKAGSAKKDEALLKISELLRENTEEIIAQMKSTCKMRAKRESHRRCSTGLL